VVGEECSTTSFCLFFFGVMELFYFMNFKKEELKLIVNNGDCLRKMMMHHKGFMSGLDGKFMSGGK